MWATAAGEDDCVGWMAHVPAPEALRVSWEALRDTFRSWDIRSREDLRNGWDLISAYFRKNSMLTNRPASRQVHLRSHSGRNAGVVFSHAPTTTECTVPPHLFRVLLLERL